MEDGYNKRFKKFVDLINALLKDMPYVNFISKPKFDKNMDKTTIIQLGNSVNEKLFLLNALIKEEIDRNKADQTSEILNNNAFELIGCIKNILSVIEPTYTIRILDFPGIEIPCSNIFESKRMANEINFRTNVSFKGQVVF